MAFKEYENDDDPIVPYDDRYADMRSEFNSSLVIEVTKRQNTIYGQNGEPYHAPIKGADLIGLESFLKRLLYSDETPYRIKRVQGVEYGYPLPMAASNTPPRPIRPIGSCSSTSIGNIRSAAARTWIGA